VSNGNYGSREKMLKGSSRGPGFIARVESEGLPHPGRRVEVNSESDNRRD
jgi:hypothetical protein